MNLLELMLKEEVEWPVGAEFAAQLGNMSIGFFYSNPEFHGEWCGTYETPSVSFKFLCEDWSTRIITIEEYQAAGGVIANDGFEPFVSVEDAQECKAEHAATSKQSPPKGSGNPILGMVLADLTNRALEGKEKYGEPLKAHNGRNALWDAYQEALDLAMYLRQLIQEQQDA